jgi:hypothetical protein
MLNNPQQEPIIYQYKLAHKPLPLKNSESKRLASHEPVKNSDGCRVPQCAAFRYGKASKVPWRVKGDPKDGQLFMAKHAFGWIRPHYHVATISVDHHSRFESVYLTGSDTAAETLVAKHAVEGYARTMGVSIQYYHADNGQFSKYVFMQDARDQRQIFSSCGVNSNFQSGIAERRIRDLQEGARTSLTIGGASQSKRRCGHSHCATGTTCSINAKEQVPTVTVGDPLQTKEPAEIEPFLPTRLSSVSRRQRDPSWQQPSQMAVTRQVRGVFGFIASPRPDDITGSGPRDGPRVATVPPPLRRPVRNNVERPNQSTSPDIQVAVTRALTEGADSSNDRHVPGRHSKPRS